MNGGPVIEGRVAAVPHTNPCEASAARSAGRLARMNRIAWLMRNFPSVVTNTGPSSCVPGVGARRPASPATCRTRAAAVGLRGSRSRRSAVRADGHLRTQPPPLRCPRTRSSPRARKPGGCLLANGTAVAVSSHRSPGTVPGCGRWRSDCSVRRTPRSAISTVAIVTMRSARCDPARHVPQRPCSMHASRHLRDGADRR